MSFDHLQQRFVLDSQILQLLLLRLSMRETDACCHAYKDDDVKRCEIKI
jgi:hypothetical protein